MKICYLDLNERDFQENYSQKPFYGGGRAYASCALQKYNDFYIYGDANCFINVTEDKLGQCHVLDWPAREAIRNGAPIKDFIPEIESFDILVHHFTQFYVNTTLKQVVWAVGRNDAINPRCKNLCLFDPDNQAPIFLGLIRPRIFKFVLGVPIPEFQKHEKQDLMFACSRITPSFQTREIANLCNRHKIKVVFAGPKDTHYNIDDLCSEYVSYLGLISQDEKMYYNSIAKACPQFQNYPISVTLAGKEALARGTPILCTNVGGWRDFIDGNNGRIIYNEDDFIKAWDARDTFSQRSCHNSVKDKFSEEKMIKSFEDIFDYIIKN